MRLDYISLLWPLDTRDWQSIARLLPASTQLLGLSGLSLSFLLSWIVTNFTELMNSALNRVAAFIELFVAVEIPYNDTQYSAISLSILCASGIAIGIRSNNSIGIITLIKELTKNPFDVVNINIHNLYTLSVYVIRSQIYVISNFLVSFLAVAYSSAPGILIFLVFSEQYGAGFEFFADGRFYNFAQNGFLSNYINFIPIEATLILFLTLALLAVISQNASSFTRSMYYILKTYNKKTKLYLHALKFYVSIKQLYNSKIFAFLTVTLFSLLTIIVVFFLIPLAIFVASGLSVAFYEFGKFTFGAPELGVSHLWYYGLYSFLFLLFFSVFLLTGAFTGK